MKSYPLSNIFEVFKKLNYVYNTKPYMLNIVGIRVNEVPNTFDDTMVVFWKDNNNVWNKREYPITTDTGTFWLNNPMEKKLGSGMMKEGQYLDTYKIGKHKGKYNNSSSKQIIDYNNSIIESVSNIVYGVSITNDKYLFTCFTIFTCCSIVL